MKKTLTENITRYDDKMMLQFNGKTFKAAGIGAVVALPVGGVLYLLAGVMPALVIGVLILVAVFILQVGTLQGMPLITFLSGLLKVLFCPGAARKPYAHDPAPDRLSIFPHHFHIEPEQKERKN